MTDCTSYLGKSEWNACNACKNYTGQEYECCTAVYNMNNLINTFNKELESYGINLASYTRWIANWNDWNNKKGKYSHWQDTYNSLVNEKKNWNNCVDANTTGFRDDWCSQDIGTGWHQVGWDQSNCGIYRKGTCQRTFDKINSDWNASGYFQDEPLTDPNDSTKKFLRGQSVPIMPSFNNNSQIVCCSQTFDQLSAKAINISDISQTCSASSNTTNAPVSKNNTNTGNTTTNTNINNNTIIGIVIIIVIFILLLISSSFSFP